MRAFIVRAANMHGIRCCMVLVSRGGRLSVQCRRYVASFHRFICTSQEVQGVFASSHSSQLSSNAVCEQRERMCSLHDAIVI